MSSATTICGRSSEGVEASSLLSSHSAFWGVACHSPTSDLTSARPSTPQTAPAGTTRPASSLLIAAAVVFRSGSLSGLKTAQFAFVTVPFEPRYGVGSSPTCQPVKTGNGGEVREGTPVATGYNSRSGRNLFAGGDCREATQNSTVAVSEGARKGNHPLARTEDAEYAPTRFGCRMRQKAGNGGCDHAACNPFPVERDLPPRILRLTNPVTSPAASRRVVAGGETLNQPTNKGE
jgi:hypothetical protein